MTTSSRTLPVVNQLFFDRDHRFKERISLCYALPAPGDFAGYGYLLVGAEKWSDATEYQIIQTSYVSNERTWAVIPHDVWANPVLAPDRPVDKIPRSCVPVLLWSLPVKREKLVFAGGMQWPYVEGI